MKKILLFTALAVMVLAGCKKDTVTPAAVPAFILYFHSDGRLMVGKWGTGTVTSANIAYFQFGSVVGFDVAGVWNAASVKFNPTTTASYASYGGIRNYGTSPTAWAGTIAASPSVSSPAYHNAANIRIGKGDPCKLVGLSRNMILGMSNAAIEAYQSGWRLPTAQENARFVQGPNPVWQTWVAGDDYYHYINGNQTTGTAEARYWDVTGTAGPNNWAQAWFPVVQNAAKLGFNTTGERLPAAGDRSTSGTVGTQGAGGYYWSSTARSSTGGFSLFFTSMTVGPVNAFNYAYGFTVRCVPQE